MSPRTKEQFETMRESATTKIMGAALELFGTIGYQSTTIAQIAEKARVSKGLIYNYFDSKEALLKEMTMTFFSSSEELIEQSKSSDPKQMLKTIIHTAFVWLKEHEKQNRLILSIVTQVDRFDFVHQLATSKMKEYLDLVTELLKEINIPDYRTEARILTTLMDGIGIQYLILKGDYPLKEMEDTLIKKYCS